MYCDTLGTYAPLALSNCWKYEDVSDDDEIRAAYQNNQKGCDHEECQRAVCDCDDYCCTISWDIVCRISETCSSKVLCCEEESNFQMDELSVMSNTVVFLEKSLLTEEALYFTNFAFGPLITPKGDCIKIFQGYFFIAWYQGGMENRNVMLSRSKIGSNKWVHIKVCSLTYFRLLKLTM